MDIVIYDVIAVFAESLLVLCNEEDPTNLANASNEKFMREKGKKFNIYSVVLLSFVPMIRNVTQILRTRIIATIIIYGTGIATTIISKE